MDTPFNGKISLKLCTESLAHKSDFLAEAVKKSNSKKMEFSSTSHLNPVDFFIFLFSSSCLSVTIISSDNTVRNIKVTPKAVEVKIYQKLSVQRNYPFNEIYSKCLSIYQTKPQAAFQMFTAITVLTFCHDQSQSYIQGST